ncbi:MAG: hypothetical protein K0R98_717 [Rickettsiaceae bacterium]|nr:hypothetical protein [Rickettsiaceae bacterium]
MALFDLPRPDFLVSGEKARLIPSVADTSRECRITSILLATLMSVEEFGKSMLGSLGVRVGKTSKIQCFTEVVFKGDAQNKIRPDGLIIVKTGGKEWRAIVESKIGKNELDKAQVEAYLDLCKQFNIDAIVTISNHFVTDAKHHPLQFNKLKTRNVELCHWSWMYLVTEAIMWTNHYGVADSDQGYILTEFVRYLQHPSSGILSFDRMSTEWKNVATTIQNGLTVNKTSPDVLESVNNWHQFVRSLSLEMSVAVGRTVTVALRREYQNDPQKRIMEDCASLTAGKLEAELDVPNAASRIKFSADFMRRTISTSMRLKAPEDKVRAKARINWLFSQIKNNADDNLLVKVIWPSRTPDTSATLGALKANADVVLSDKTDFPPVAFELIFTRDLAARFKGAQTFVQDAQSALLEFYEKTGQHLREWVPAPPKVSISNPTQVLDGTSEQQYTAANEQENVAVETLPESVPEPVAVNE